MVIHRRLEGSSRHRLERCSFHHQNFILAFILLILQNSLSHSWKTSYTNTAAFVSIHHKKLTSPLKSSLSTSKRVFYSSNLRRKKTYLQSVIHDLSSTYALPPIIPGEDFQTRLRKNQRIVAFGDVHGDISALIRFLIIAQVLNPQSTLQDPQWCGKDTIVVQCGDILDRGENELACLRLLSILSRQARAHGGALHILYGNHESLNCVGNFEYAIPQGNDEFELNLGKELDSLHNNKKKWRLQYAGNVPARWKAFEPGGLLSKSLLARMHVAMVIGRSVFVHGGLTADHIKKWGGIQQMNDAARAWIIQSHHGANNDQGNFFSVNDVLASATFRSSCAKNSRPECLGGGIGSPSPVWLRDYSMPSDKIPRNPNAQAMIDECLKDIGHGVTRMVMGHTPQERINAALSGKAWRVDVGASAGVWGGTPECLEIIHGGDEEKDIISILTLDGQKIPAKDRYVWEQLF